MKLVRPTIRINRARFSAPGVKGPVLYRCFDYDKNKVVYIGQSGNLQQRLIDHEPTKWWWPCVDHITVQRYPRNAELLLNQNELRAIVAEQPRFNDDRYKRHRCRMPS